jgi:four helix bundle protein
MQDFRKLLVWHKAQTLCTRLDPIVERIAKRKPGLADQIDRSANSIPANIAEGCGRETKADKRKFLTTSISSSMELESHFVRATNANLVTSAECESLTADSTEIRKMLHGLRNKCTEVSEIRLAPHNS